MSTAALNKERNSSIELFRILAMFLVVFVHMNGYFLIRGHGIPEDINGYGYKLFVNQYFMNNSLIHEYIQSLCRVCVNCFIIISGYYGIKLRAKSLWALLLTVICVDVPFAVVMYLLHPSLENIQNIFLGFFGLTGHGYFIQCYVMLMFLSPVLNSFIEKYGCKILKYVIVFVFIEGYICLFRDDEIGIENGYRIIHFVLLYLLARCLYLYKDELSKINNWWYLLIYFGGAALMTFLYQIGFTKIGSYSNPLCIVMAVGLFIPFTKKVFHNKFINWIAAGTFTVYLINTRMPGSGLYLKLDNYLFDNFSLLQFYILAVAVVVLFLLSVVYDKAAKYITKPINNAVCKYIDKTFTENILD